MENRNFLCKVQNFISQDEYLKRKENIIGKSIFRDRQTKKSKITGTE